MLSTPHVTPSPRPRQVERIPQNTRPSILTGDANVHGQQRRESLKSTSRDRLKTASRANAGFRTHTHLASHAWGRSTSGRLELVHGTVAGAVVTGAFVVSGVDDVAGVG